MDTFFVKSFLKNYKMEIILLCLFSILTSVFTLISPLFIQYIIDDVILNKHFELLWRVLFFLIMSYVLSLIAVFIQNYLSEYVRIKIFQEKTLDLIPIILSSPKYLSTGDLISRLTDNLRIINSFISSVIPHIALNIINLIIPFVIMFYINRELCLLIVGPTVLCFFIFYILGIKIERIEEQLLITNSKLFSCLKEIFSLKEFIKSYGIQNFFLNRFAEDLEKYKKETLVYAKYSSINISSDYILTGIPMVFIIIYGSYLIINSRLTLGNFMAFITYISLLFGPLMELGSLWISYKSVLPAISRIKELYNLQIVDSGNDNLFISDGIIEFKNVCFNYEGKPKILENFNQKFIPGVNYLVGDNGSGKTTIFRLICKLYLPDKGIITIDNQNINQISLDSLASEIGIVFSDSYLFEDTIYNNIILNNSNTKKSDVIKVSKKVKLHEFIMSLPNGYDTMINEAGINFSAGEKQKIALARVLLKNPKILLLDEITHSVDKLSKKEIMKCILSMKEDKTIIIISHELNAKSVEGNVIYI